MAGSDDAVAELEGVSSASGQVVAKRCLTWEQVERLAAFAVIALLAFVVVSPDSRPFGGFRPGSTRHANSSQPQPPQQQQREQAAPTADIRVFAAPQLPFRPPHSRCVLHPNGSVEVAAEWESAPPGGFLASGAGWPSDEEACGHCSGNVTAAHVLRCCGVCRLPSCARHYPGERRAVEGMMTLAAGGYQLWATTPCELFQRIRGRTLWLMGDSQTEHFYSSLECFLREFATDLRRRPAVAGEENDRLSVTQADANQHLKPQPPMCLPLALGTRVCFARIHFARDAYDTVLPGLLRLVPDFTRDLLVLNVGLHYPVPGREAGRPPENSALVTDVAALGRWWAERRHMLPKLIWADVSIQHFETADGAYHGGNVPFYCTPLAAWYAGDAQALAGGPFNSALEPVVAGFADARLRTWNATVPLWRQHSRRECSHFCGVAYQAYTHLLLSLMRDTPGLGTPADAPAAAAAAAAERVAVAAAEAAALARGTP